MIAQVIVDVAAKQTDRVFEYHIPQELTDVAVGSRVVVPFGNMIFKYAISLLSSHIYNNLCNHLTYQDRKSVV